MAAGDTKESLGPLGDEQLQAEIRNRRKLVEQQERADWRLITDGADGRRVLRWILDQCHLHTPSFALDSHVMALREGERNVGLMVMAQVERMAPDGWKLLMLETMNDAISKRRAAEVAALEEDTEDGDT